MLGSGRAEPSSLHVPSVRHRWLAVVEVMRKVGAGSHSQIRRLRDNIEFGVSFPLSSLPPPARMPNTPAVFSHHEFCADRLRYDRDLLAVSPASPSAEWVHPLHVILKAGKKPRLVLDLSRNLNDHIEPIPLRYETVQSAVAASRPGVWYAKIDIADCFLSFPMHPDYADYLTFSFDGVTYKYSRLPFGLSSAPAICSELLGVISFELARAGITHKRMLDDFIIIAESLHECSLQLAAALHIFRAFGLVVNEKKLCGPSQAMPFLGVVLDSSSCTLECTQERIEELLAALKDVVTSRTVRAHKLATLLGKLGFAAQVLPFARPFLRRLLTLHASCRSRWHHVTLPAAVRADLRYWMLWLPTWSGRLLWPQVHRQAVQIFTDASTQGFGIFVAEAPEPLAQTLPVALRPGSGYYGVWGYSHAAFCSKHTAICWSELFAVLAAVRLLAPFTRGRRLVVHVDNAPVVSVLRRQLSRSPALSGLLREVAAVCHEFNVELVAEHLLGVDNAIADFLSRPVLHHFVSTPSATYPLARGLRYVSVLCSREVLA